ncbi:MAG: ABC transporter permease [Candidatus Aenigmatarchaeota archaeon]
MGMFAEYIKLTTSNLAKRKKRSLLTIIAIVIGVSAVVALISLGYGLQDTINEQFEMMGTDKLMIMPSGSMFGIGGSSGLTEHDIDVIQGVNGVKLAGGMVYKVSRVEFRNEDKYTFVSGIPTDETAEIIDSMQSFKIIDGRNLKDGDGNVAVVGYLIGTGDFFGKKAYVGDKITVEGTKFNIIGIMDKIGNSQDDSQLLIPLDSARKLFEEPDALDAIIAQSKAEYNTSKVADDIEKAMRKDRGIKEGEEDFTVQTSEQLLAMFSTIFALVFTVVVGIAGISLIVGGVGIMNTMYMSILERTREIGVMKAIGASDREVSLIFLIESGLLGLFGGAIGCSLGIAMAKGVEIAVQKDFAILKASVTPELIIGALLFSFIIGLVSGYLPSRRAAKLQPVEALRYE